MLPEIKSLLLKFVEEQPQTIFDLLIEKQFGIENIETKFDTDFDYDGTLFFTLNGKAYKVSMQEPEYGRHINDITTIQEASFEEKTVITYK